MIISNRGKNYLINLIIVSSIFLLDRFSKIYVIYLNDKLLVSEIFSSKFLNINLIWNQGIAFGLFSFNELKLYNILTILILIIIFPAIKLIGINIIRQFINLLAKGSFKRIDIFFKFIHRGL